MNNAQLFTIKQTASALGIKPDTLRHRLSALRSCGIIIGQRIEEGPRAPILISRDDVEWLRRQFEPRKKN
jgi:hypothetical protein